MKLRYLLSFAVILSSFVLMSWGVTGHRAIAKIAENHLTPKAKNAVHELLGDENLSDVSTWADEVRRNQEYKYTTPWHYINLPLGLTYDQFKQKVESMTEDNVYSAILKQEQVLRDKNTPQDKKIEALKFIVHFVGDLHQPMHISRAEDQGGNTIQLNYDDKGTNLHSLWDSRLIDHQGLNFMQLADKNDNASAADIKKLQHDPLIRWMWESYEVSSKLYAEADQMKSRSLDNSYYDEHIQIINTRIQQAGLRLAGLLNTIFENGNTAVN